MPVRNSRYYENIVFEGGGVHGIGYIGCLRELERRGLRNYIRRFGGASIGSLTAVMAALHVPAKVMLRESLTLTKDILTGGIYAPVAAYNLIKHWGLYSPEYARNWMGLLLERYGGSAALTFHQLHARTGNDVYIAIYNRTKSRAEIISRHSDPHMPLVDVLLASIAFPGFFMPVTLPGRGGDLFIDGGVTNNFPIYLFDTGHLPNPRTLGVRSISDTSHHFSGDINYAPPAPTSLPQYLEGIIGAMIESGQQRYEKPDDAKRTIFMVLPSRIASMDFDVSREDKMLLYDLGVESTQKFFSASRSRRKVTRSTRSSGRRTGSRGRLGARRTGGDYSHT